MKQKNGSPVKEAGAMLLKWIICFVLSAAILFPCVQYYINATRPPEGTVYIGSAPGMFCDVTAELTVADGRIVNVRLSGDAETPELGGVVLAQMPAGILEAQSPMVDGMAGATVTTNAVRGAVTAAMEAAGLQVPLAGEVYTGRAQGMMCEIVAEINVADGRIVGVTLTGDAETPSLGGVVLAEMPAKIIEAQSPMVDGMAGATVTTDAVRSAVTAAMTEAGLIVPDTEEVFTGHAQGANGEVTAEVTVLNGAVADIKVTGDVLSAEAVQAAINDALTQAGLVAETAEEAPEAPAGEVFTASAQGFGGEIIAEVTIAEGKIVDVKLTGDSETPGLGGRAIEEMPAQILEAQSAEVDGIAGATISSTAIRTAVADALAQAGLTAEEPQAEPVPETEPVSETEPAPAVPTASRENGVITAAEWESAYPEIVASYTANGANDYILDYLEADPYLVSIYEGYGFAKQYGSARGHEYCLEDLSETARPHPLANCLTCKTADFTKLVNDQGVGAYSLDFNEVMASMSENVGCYNCHANEPGKMTVTHDYIIDRLGDNMDSINPATLSCGQCHIEYYFVPDTKATSVPYSDVAGMDPEAILAYYDSIGFSDWIQPSTGAPMLKAQHPEMETYLNGSVHAMMGLSCASCHMEKQDGYTSHELVSPLKSETLLGYCATCHGDTDMPAKVGAIQEAVTARETEIGNSLAAFKDQLAAAVASGEYTDEELDAIRQVYRQAQWYFDFDYVENAEGAHNSRLANRCLDKSAELIAQGVAMFHA